MTDRITRDEYGLELAYAAAKRADCTRRQVGAVIVDPAGEVVKTGYNGLASGLPGCLTAGACPRGQMAYPTEPPVKVGDPDPTPHGELDLPALQEVGCAEASANGYVCTLDKGSHAWHIAGTGYSEEVVDVWANEEQTQAASTGYEQTGCRAVHAEVNAVIRAGRAACVGATIYVTDEPCFHCSVVIEGAGIVRVVYPDGEIRFAQTNSKAPLSLWSPA